MRKISHHNVMHSHQSGNTSHNQVLQAPTSHIFSKLDPPSHASYADMYILYLCIGVIIKNTQAMCDTFSQQRRLSCNSLLGPIDHVYGLAKKWKKSLFRASQCPSPHPDTHAQESEMCHHTNVHSPSSSLNPKSKLSKNKKNSRRHQPKREKMIDSHASLAMTQEFQFHKPWAIIWILTPMIYFWFWL